jgi:hypothetical protein
MKKRVVVTAAVLLAACAVSNLDAMPAFARKYQMSCKTCHAPFPRLKPYGEEFAGNGFVIKDKDTPRAYIDTGDDFLSLLREVPLALRLEGFLTYNNGARKQLDFASPYLLKLLSGGEITKNISYYFYFFLGERGEVAGLEDAFVMFNDLFGTDVDVVVGQFQVSDPLFRGVPDPGGLPDLQGASGCAPSTTTGGLVLQAWRHRPGARGRQQDRDRRSRHLPQLRRR